MLALGLSLDKPIMNNRKKIRTILGKNLITSRAGLALDDPTRGFNVTTMATVANNFFAAHGDYGYVGGTEEIFTFDFSTKVAGSVAECPMRIFRGSTTNISTINPTSLLTYTELVQSEIDVIKTQDNNAITQSHTLNTYYEIIGLELDVTPIVNAISGGSNADFKTNKIKSISVDIYAKGSGVNGGVTTNGSIGKIYDSSTSAWAGAATNSTGSIALANITTQYSKYIDSNNKIYVLVQSQYPSNGTIASNISIDYIKITVVTNRVADVVQPINVDLPKYWCMLVKGFSPNWDNNNTVVKRVFDFPIDSNNKFGLIWDTTKKFIFTKTVVGVTTYLTLTSPTFSKNQIYNLLVGQSTTGMYIFALKNSGSLEKNTNTDIQQLIGLSSLYCLTRLNGVDQGDALLELITDKPIDLQSLGKSSGFTDAEALAILQGTQPNLLGIYQKELFNINAVTLHANATRNGNTITLNATAGYQASYIDISVLPNNRYTLKFNKTGLKGYVDIREKYNNIILASLWANGKDSQGDITINFVTPNNCNIVRLEIMSDLAGVYTWSNLSIQVLM